MKGLAGSRVVVFGASSGVGARTAEVFAGAGAEVVITGRDAERLEGVRRGLGETARAEVVDGRNAQSVAGFFEELGPIDHLVVPAGQTNRGGSFTAHLTLEAFRETFEGKFWVQMAAAHAGAKQLKKGGSLTLISGGAAHRALEGMVNVAAVNGAIEAVVPGLARELAPTRVNAISPGTLHTGYWRGTPDETLKAIFDKTASALPAGRVGTADDIARAALFLAESDFVTGVVLPVDGGLPLSSL